MFSTLMTNVIFELFQFRVTITIVLAVDNKHYQTLM